MNQFVQGREDEGERGEEDRKDEEKGEEEDKDGKKGEEEE